MINPREKTPEKVLPKRRGPPKRESITEAEPEVLVLEISIKEIQSILAGKK